MAAAIGTGRAGDEKRHFLPRPIDWRAPAFRPFNSGGQVRQEWAEALRHRQMRDDRVAQ